MNKKLSLRSRIFLTMISLVIVASVLIAGVTVIQYKEQAEDYHSERLLRKESQVSAQVDYVLRYTTYEVSTENLGYIFKDQIYEIADVQNLNFNIFDLDGNLIISSRPMLEGQEDMLSVPPSVLDSLQLSLDKRVVQYSRAAGQSFRSSYTYILDRRFKPIGILHIPYYEDDTFNANELKAFLTRLAMVYLAILLLAIILAYLTSTYITRSLKTISDKLKEASLADKTLRIELQNPSSEIGGLIDAYNRMVDKLERSVKQLAKSEREQAWREMARQVAHEIKNPLTPMRLSVQSFERKFDKDDPELEQKLKQFTGSLIQQIDTMSSIASAFSNFAQMPVQKNEELDVVDTVRLALNIFNEDYIQFIQQQDSIIARIDRAQLVRVVTNLVKNAIQSIPEGREPKVVVQVFSEGDQVKISVADNGSGIDPQIQDKLFEPRFTTKSSGMGLGLGMVKNIVESYRGSINFTTVPAKGTVFTVSFPRFYRH